MSACMHVRIRVRRYICTHARVRTWYARVQVWPRRMGRVDGRAYGRKDGWDGWDGFY